MDEQLIEKVKEHEVLYNHGSHDYRDQHIRQSAWEEIGKELNISGKYKCVLSFVKLLLKIIYIMIENSKIILYNTRLVLYYLFST